MNIIWIILIVVVLIILFRFFNSLNKDNEDLRNETLSEKFRVIVNILNDAAFKGRGQIIPLDKRSFNLYEDDQNQIINFLYGTGHLTITWKYKYFQKEVIHEKQFNDARNLSLFEQQKIAEIMIKEMSDVVSHHKENVWSQSPLFDKYANDIVLENDKEVITESDTTNEMDNLVTKIQMISSKNNAKVEVSHIGSELIMNMLEPNLVQQYYEMHEVIEKSYSYSPSDVSLAKSFFVMLKEAGINSIRNQNPEDKRLFQKAGVKKYTSLIDGNHIYTVDYS